MEAERPLRRFAVVKGGNGARARAGLTLEVTHCGPARVPPCERSHTTVDPACYALIGGSLSLGVTSMGHLGRTQNSQAVSEKKLTAYACELEQKLEARTRELSEAREQQTATSEVLRIISSSPGKLEPVFEAVLANAVRICEAKFGNLLLYDGNAFRMAAMLKAPPAFAEFLGQRGWFLPEAGNALDRVWKSKRVIHTIDAAAEPVPSPSAKLAGAR